MAETVEQLASEKARTPPRPKGRPTKIGGKPQPIPVQNAGPGPGLEVDSGEPEIEIDPKQLQVMVHNWLTVLADIPCQMMRARPLTRQENGTVLYATEKVIDAYMPALTKQGVLYMWVLTMASVYGKVWMEKNAAKLQSPPVAPPQENPGDREERMGQNGIDPAFMQG